MDEQLEIYVENMDWQLSKMVNGVQELDDEQMTQGG